MSDLLVIAFDNEADGFDLRTELVKMQQEYLIELEDAVVVTRDASSDAPSLLAEAQAIARIRSLAAHDPRAAVQPT